MHPPEYRLSGTSRPENRLQRPSLRPFHPSRPLLSNYQPSCVFCCEQYSTPSARLVQVLDGLFAGGHLPSPEDVPIDVQLSSYHVSAASICTAPVSIGNTHNYEGVVQSVHGIQKFVPSSRSVLSRQHSGDKCRLLTADSQPQWTVEVPTWSG